ncbi:MAG: class I SAM-dependent methyltransferase [Pyrinomonadaceae bacterium]|nr:class I SAM-dependent methyltransferase [Pyrinomonadaceae bacterium]
MQAEKKSIDNAEQLQREHYDDIADDYAAHYGDDWSQKYRYKFINEPMFGELDLSGAEVVDALCGSGETTGYLLEKGAKVTGVDISPDEIEVFETNFPDSKVQCASILSTGLESDSYDCVGVVGGLHHLHPNLIEAVDEMHRLLKPGGYFCFMEPHSGSLPDLVRKLWYRYDKLFADNEAAIDLTLLKKEFSSKFEFVKEDYKGNIAFLLVLNSLVFRIPLWLKPIYSPFLIAVESIIQKIQGPKLSCFVVCRWRKI